MLSARAAGADVSMSDAVEEFEAALNAEPEPMSREYLELRHALGV